MTYKEFSLIIRELSSDSIVVPLLTGIISFKHLNKQMKYFFFFICLTTITEFILDYTSTRNINNWGIIDIYAIVEFTFYSLVVAILIHNKWMKALILICIIGFLPYGIRQHLSPDFTTFRTTAHVIASILLTFFFGYYLIEKTIRFDERNIYFDAFFFVAVGGIIFFSLSAISMAFLDKLLLNVNPYHNQVIFGAINIICNCIFAYAFLHQRKLKRRVDH
jgi:hypothetical protein